MRQGQRVAMAPESTSRRRFMVGAAGTVLSVNAFGAAQLGYTPGELIGQSVLTVFFEEDQELVKGHVATCLEEVGRSHSWEIRKIRKDGGVIWVRENAKTVRRRLNRSLLLLAKELAHLRPPRKDEG